MGGSQKGEREKETLVRERRTREEEGETWERKKTKGGERKGKEPPVFFNQHSQCRGPRFDPW